MAKIKVCDALCGQGKTQSCIHMINTDKENKKYIFITPYLTEVERIKNACITKQFVSPEKKWSNGYSKLSDLIKLLGEGRNIVSTHALFSFSNDEVKKLIKEQNYTLILDEVIDLFSPVKMDNGDVDFIVRNNIARKEGDNIIWEDDEYKGVYFSEIVKISEARNLVKYDNHLYFWALPIDVFNCFTDIYILTYMFKYQLMKYFFEANDLDYELIGTKHTMGVYHFCDIDEMDRRIDLSELITVCDDNKRNKIGMNLYDLSVSWYEREINESGESKISKLRSNLYNFLRNPKCSQNDKMWTTFNKFKKYLKGKGYSSGFITFNKRATNDYSNRHRLAYCVNIFMLPWMKNYLMRIGAKNVNQNMWALSVLIQWLFRSAIRNGERVSLYIPSIRMRHLLKQWIINLKEGRDLDEISYLNDDYKKEKLINCIEDAFNI